MVIHLFKKSFLDFFYLLFLDFKVLICKCSSRAYRGVRLVKWYFFFRGVAGAKLLLGGVCEQMYRGCKSGAVLHH